MFENISVWTWVAVPLIGMIAGLLIHAIQNSNTLMFPYRDRENGSFYLGFISDMFWGMTGATITVLAFLLAPQGNLAVIFYAVIGGISGQVGVWKIIQRYNDALDDKAEELLDSIFVGKEKEE